MRYLKYFCLCLGIVGILNFSAQAATLDDIKEKKKEASKLRFKGNRILADKGANENITSTIEGLWRFSEVIDHLINVKEGNCMLQEMYAGKFVVGVQELAILLIEAVDGLTVPGNARRALSQEDNVPGTWYTHDGVTRNNAQWQELLRLVDTLAGEINAAVGNLLEEEDSKNKNESGSQEKEDSEEEDSEDYSESSDELEAEDSNSESESESEEKDSESDSEEEEEVENDLGSETESEENNEPKGTGYAVRQAVVALLDFLLPRADDEAEFIEEEDDSESESEEETSDESESDEEDSETESEEEEEDSEDEGDQTNYGGVTWEGNGLPNATQILLLRNNQQRRRILMNQVVHFSGGGASSFNQ